MCNLHTKVTKYAKNCLFEQFWKLSTVVIVVKILCFQTMCMVARNPPKKQNLS